MYLVDTNVFLELLLAQEKRQVCKKFLDAAIGNIYISDFSLSKELYEDLAGTKVEQGLDFDDAYQYRLAKEADLEIVTMDSDFEKISNKIKVKFL